MSTEARTIRVGGITVDVVRKAIKNAHLAVYPPTGRVRLAVPAHMSDQSIRLLAISRIGWIRKHQGRVAAQPRETPREYVTGESHWFRGRRHLLSVEYGPGKHRAYVKGGKRIVLHVRPGTTTANRERVLREWYRGELYRLAAPIVALGAERIGVPVPELRIKDMRTKWGTCNAGAKRIWLNLELAKKPARSVEYIVVHELIHLLERTHNDRFRSLMDQHLPDWRFRRAELNALPVKYEG